MGNGAKGNVPGTEGMSDYGGTGAGGAGGGYFAIAVVSGSHGGNGVFYMYY